MIGEEPALLLISRWVAVMHERYVGWGETGTILEKKYEAYFIAEIHQLLVYCMVGQDQST